MDPQFWLFAAVGFAAQLVDGALGMAYGVICSTVLLALGVTPANTSASVHAAKVFTGAEPMSTWDKFQDELKTLGIDDALKVQQAALERYNKR